MSEIRIKICGLTRVQDAEAAERAGADYGGVILAPGSPRTVDNRKAAEVLGATSLIRCGVFVNQTVDRVLESAGSIGLAVAQLHGDESPDYIRQLRDRSSLEIWKALRIRNADDFLSGVETFGEWVDGLLLDSYSEDARGGTGRAFPWSEVRSQRERMPVQLELIAAGGLRPENVGQVVTELSPTVVDVSSGVEQSPGIKSADRIAAFVAAVHEVHAKENVG